MDFMTVADYYADKSIFITGATGFLGKVLVEKLLRCCPNIRTIYMLMRPKKDQDPKIRLEGFISNRVFERLLTHSPKSIDKLKLIPGDVTEEDLGISLQDKKELQEECQIIIHSAATVRFDVPLRDAVNINVLGTKRVLELAKEMNKLKVFLYISTAYCRSDLEVIEERVYPAKHNPEDVIACSRWMDDSLMRSIERKLIKPEPNTYAYTKFLTETLISQYAGRFPIAIARPSIVVASYSEPMPGWVDNLNGPTGVIVGIGKGLIRSVHCDGSAVADLIPVDIVVNGCIILAYKTGLGKFREIQVCNMTNSLRNLLTWQDAANYILTHARDYPFKEILWYPDSQASTRLQHSILELYKHYIPAYFIDFMLLLMRKDRFMVKLQNHITYGLRVLDFYMNRNWNFKNEKFLSLQNDLCLEDKQTYFTDVKVLHWNSFMKEYIRGTQQYYFNDDLAHLPQARHNLKRMYYARRVFKVVRLLVAMYLGYSFLRVIISYM